MPRPLPGWISPELQQRIRTQAALLLVVGESRYQALARACLAYDKHLRLEAEWVCAVPIIELGDGWKWVPGKYCRGTMYWRS